MNEFNGSAPPASLTIVKIGGNVIDDESLLARTLDTLAGVDEDFILVHGGGIAAQRLAEKINVPQTMVHGRRITEKDTLDIAVMVYAGLISKRIVAEFQGRGRNAIGLSGADVNCMLAAKRPVGNIDFGFVGDVIPAGVNTRFLSMLLAEKITPVLCAITHDGNGVLLNTNADSIASVLAMAFAPLCKVRVLFCFDKPGVLLVATDPDSVISQLTECEYKRLCTKGSISGGMLPKLDGAFDMLRAGAASVRILHASALALSADDIMGGTELVL